MGKDLKLISLKLSEDLIEVTKQMANTKELSMSAFIRLAIINYLNDLRKEAEGKEN